MICGATSEPYFDKQYTETKFWDALSVSYYKCPDCGFVHSATHQEMSQPAWVELNNRCHRAFETTRELRNINQPPYAEMALALSILAKNGVVRTDRVMDYAAGYGTLAKVLSKYFGTDIACYDKYVTDDAADGSVRYVGDDALSDYSLVINSAMFEHVLSRQDLDDVNDIVAQDGVLMLHTVICETIPKNPDWFYLAPIVHCAFHTNTSMTHLMRQWGYSDSIYAPAAKSWFLFKEDNPVTSNLAETVAELNDELQCTFFHQKVGFMYYWKGF